MSNLSEVIDLASHAVHAIHKGSMNIRNPCGFALVIIIWLLLIVYTCKRQSYYARRRRQSLTIQNMQLEIRKMLKQEQEAVNMIKRKLHENMTDSDQERMTSQAPELQQLSTIVKKMNSQLMELELCLKEYDIET